jgi:hypothetical protein
MFRYLLTAALFLLSPALAHHGWSSFEQDKPLYLQGTVKSVRWANPHAEAVIEVAPDLKLPNDLASREMPRQTQAVDGAALVKKTALPPSPAGEWQLEFAPMFRMQAWGLGEAPKVGDRIEVIGYTAPTIARGRLMRVEYVFHGGRAGALRSSPAN